MKKEKNKSIKQFVLFWIVGYVNWLVNYVAYSVLVSLGAHYVVGNIVGFILSVLSSYLLNGKLVFKEKDIEGERVWWRVLLRLYISYAGTGLILSNLLLYLWLNVIDISQYMTPLTTALAQAGLKLTDAQTAKYMAPIINAFIITPLNFVVNKFWAYKNKEKKS